jgi:DNA-binding FrmR family transcriptional regulator
MPERTLTKEAKTRLRRIEGQVRGIQAMLERLDEDASPEEQHVRDLLASGTSQVEVTRELGLSRKRVSEIARRSVAAVPEPCDSLLTQILAVRAAVEQVGLLIMELHLEQCVFCDEKMDDERRRDLRETLKLWSRLSSKLR